MQDRSRERYPTRHTGTKWLDSIPRGICSELFEGHHGQRRKLLLRQRGHQYIVNHRLIPFLPASWSRASGWLPSNMQFSTFNLQSLNLIGLQVQCLQDQMALYAQYGNNVTQPISKTYASAAQQLQIACGRTFVNVTAAPLKGAASSTYTSPLTPTLTLILMFVLYLFQ